MPTPTPYNATFTALNKATAAPLETGKWTYTGGNLVPTAAFRGVFAAFPGLVMGPGRSYEIEVTTTGGDPTWYDNPGEGMGIYGLLTATGNILDNPVDDGPFITGINPEPYVDGVHVITITGEEEGYLTAMAEGRQYLGVYAPTSATITNVRWRSTGALVPTPCSSTFVTLNKATAVPLSAGKWTYSAGNLDPTQDWFSVFAVFPDLIMAPGQSYEIEITTTGGHPTYYGQPHVGHYIYGIQTATGNIIDNVTDDGPFITGISPTPYVNGTYVIPIAGSEPGYVQAMAQGRQYLGILGVPGAIITNVRWRCIEDYVPETPYAGDVHSPLYVQITEGDYQSATPEIPGVGRLKIWTGSEWKYMAPRVGEGENTAGGVGMVWTGSDWYPLRVGATEWHPADPWLIGQYYEQAGPSHSTLIPVGAAAGDLFILSGSTQSSFNCSDSRIMGTLNMHAAHKVYWGHLDGSGTPFTSTSSGFLNWSSTFLTVFRGVTVGATGVNAANQTPTIVPVIPNSTAVICVISGYSGTVAAASVTESGGPLYTAVGGFMSDTKDFHRMFSWQSATPMPNPASGFVNSGSFNQNYSCTLQLLDI